jgi:selenocysteine-specific elongation factor
MEKHVTLGVAGHIDHGKTSLTRALTNVDTDRLKEEKERNISIELGFAPLILPSGQTVGVVDVPGHERFIRQMIAGAAGIDLVILVIAADEGVMPQTREHFDIIRFLGIERGIIALTKKDLVDPDWLDMVAEEVREWVHGSFLEGAPIIPVSSVTGDGLPDLLQAIDQIVTQIPERDSSEPFRMPIDRVFTIKGAGAVVTGTVYEGEISEGEVLEVFPLGEKVKVRQIHVHHHQVGKAFAGQRTAINVSGVDFKEMERGFSLTAPDYFRKTDRLDIRFQMLESLDFSLKQRTRIRLHIATSEVMGKIIFYDRNDMEPGQEVLCQLQLEDEIIAKPGDPFILRRLSPAVTLGGGSVLSPYGVRRKFGEKSVELLKLLSEKDDWSLLQYVLAESGYETLEEIDFELALGQERLQAIVNQSKDQDKIKQFGNIIVLTEVIKEWTDNLKKTLMKYHRDYPMRAGIKKSELRSKQFTHLSDRLWKEYISSLRENNIIEETGESIKLRAHRPSLPAAIQNVVEKLMTGLMKEGLTVSDFNEAAKKAGVKPTDINEVKAFLIEQHRFVPMGEQFLVGHFPYEQTVKQLRQQFPPDAPFSTPQVKEVLGLSRKYLIPFLESLDDQGLTRRLENERVWIKSSAG